MANVQQQQRANFLRRLSMVIRSQSQRRLINTATFPYKHLTLTSNRLQNTGEIVIETHFVQKTICFVKNSFGENE